ncbi:MAG: uracil-xanthine permease family protein [Methyloceanibacter sp.]|uniref:uracil-xanthine permease family protein n=1 Tax=Methyloceanibacter sp. TaxID=1965321 RepID=UPI003D6CADC3
MAIKPPELLYGVDEQPPPARLAILGLQYAVLIGVYLIFVVMVARAASASAEVTQDLVGLGFIVLAVGTFAQAYRGKFFGSGYLAPPVFSAIYIGPAILAAEAGGLPAVAGMTIFAGLTEAVLSRLLRRLRVVFQPTIAGFTVLVVGFELGLVGIAKTLEIGKQEPAYWPHVFVAFVTLAAAVALSIWGRGVWRLSSVLLGVVSGLAAALAWGIVDAAALTSIGAARWIALPNPSFLSYSFEASLIPVFLAAGFAATLRTIGVVTTCQKINDAEWKRPDLDNIEKGVLGDAVGAVAAGLLGCLGTSSAPSLVGVSSATGATSRAIAFAAASLLAVFAFLPKVAAAVTALPSEIAGAVLIFTASFMITSGIEIVASRSLSTRACFALSIGLLLGLATQVNAGYFRALPGPWNDVLGSMLTVSLAAAIGLTLLFRIGIRRKDAMVWRTSDALAGFGRFLDKEAAAWKLNAELVERAKDGVAGVVAHLKEGHFIDAPLEISASYDGIDLLVELKYRGRAPSLGAVERGHETVHEEGAVTAGLKSFAAGAHADRTAVAVDRGNVSIKLWFSA